MFNLQGIAMSIEENLDLPFWFLPICSLALSMQIKLKRLRYYGREYKKLLYN